MPQMSDAEKASYDVVEAEAVRKSDSSPPDVSEITYADSFGKLTSDSNLTKTDTGIAIGDVSSEDTSRSSIIVSSTDTGITPPRLTNAQMLDIDNSTTPAGTYVFNTDFNQLFVKTASNGFVQCGPILMNYAERLLIQNPYKGMQITETDKDRKYTYLEDHWCLSTPKSGDEALMAFESSSNPDDEANGVANNFYIGGKYKTAYDLIFDQVTFRVNNVSAGANLNLAIYQDLDKSGNYNRLGTIEEYSLGLAGTKTVNLNSDYGSKVHIQQGEFVVIWGKGDSTAGFRMRVWNSRSNELFNTDVPEGKIPTNFTTNIQTTNTPAEVDFRYYDSGSVVTPVGDVDTAGLFLVDST